MAVAQNGMGRLIAGGALALCTWLVLLAAVTVAVEPTKDVVIIGPAERGLRALSGSRTRISDVRDMTVLARGEDPGFVRALYANGAWLVLPSRAGGCAGGADRN